MTATSLRERSKERRYRAVLLAGMRLFAEQGYDVTTVAQIAEEAEVSTRSVSAYFPTKLHIATASSSAAADRLILALRSRDEGESVVDRVVQWLREEPAFVPEEEWRLRAAMLERNPVLQGSGPEDSPPLLAIAADAIAEDLDIPPDHPGVQIALGIVAGIVVRVELLFGSHREDEETLVLIHDALSGAVDAVRRSSHSSD